MKNLKSMIKKMSDEQEIHDIQNDILKNVDMNKVRSEVYVKPVRNRRFFLVSNLFSALAAAMIVVLIVLSINTTSKEDDRVPANNETETPLENNVSLFSQYLENMLKQEAYNIINVVPSINKFNVSEVVLNEESKKMTESEMDALVNDLDSQIYNVVEMLGLASIDCVSSNNQYYGMDNNDLSSFENTITVTGPLSPYKIYFTEQNITEKNVGESNFKSNSIIYGKISENDNLYDFVGNKEYKNSKTTYLTKFELNDLVINVEEVFGDKLNEFTYTFYKGDLVKNIFVRQRFYDDGNVKLEFKLIHTRNKEYLDDWSKSTNIEVQTKNIKNSNSIEFKIDSRGNDTLIVEFNNSNITYRFKNSNTVYVK